jgi:hypothetical protein
MFVALSVAARSGIPFCRGGRVNQGKAKEGKALRISLAVPNEAKHPPNERYTSNHHHHLPISSTRKSDIL